MLRKSAAKAADFLMDDLRDLITQGVKCRGCGGLTSRRLPACYRCGRKLDGTEEALTAAELEKLKLDVVRAQAVAPAAVDPRLERSRRVLERLSRIVLWSTPPFALLCGLLGLIGPDILDWAIIIGPLLLFALGAGLASRMDMPAKR